MAELWTCLKGTDLGSKRRVRGRNWIDSWTRRRPGRPGTSWCGSVWSRTCWWPRRSLAQTARTTPCLCTHSRRLTAHCPGLRGWAGTRKVKPIWILLKQETVSDSGIGWAICKSASHSRQITTPASHHSVFYRSDALPAAQPTASKHWRRSLQVYAVALKHTTRPLTRTTHVNQRNSRSTRLL